MAPLDDAGHRLQGFEHLGLRGFENDHVFLFFKLGSSSRAARFLGTSAIFAFSIKGL